MPNQSASSQTDSLILYFNEKLASVAEAALDHLQNEIDGVDRKNADDVSLLLLRIVDFLNRHALGTGRDNFGSILVLLKNSSRPWDNDFIWTELRELSKAGELSLSNDGEELMIVDFHRMKPEEKKKRIEAKVFLTRAGRKRIGDSSLNAILEGPLRCGAIRDVLQAMANGEQLSAKGFKDRFGRHLTKIKSEAKALKENSLHILNHLNTIK